MPRPDEAAESIKINKATILTKAIEYIHSLEKKNADLENSEKTLKQHLCDTAEEAENRSDRVSPKELQPPESKPQASSPDIEFTSSSSEVPQGLIPVPENIRRLRDTGPQPHYADNVCFANREQCSSPGKISIKGGKTLGKLMVGSLAGLMVLDITCTKSEEDRGLSALPSLKTMSNVLSQPLAHHLLLHPLVRCLLVFCSLGLVLFLYLFNSKPKLGQPPAQLAHAAAFKSAPSSVEIRRNAWLTSIQTVWVPRHSILPEMWGLILETHAYMTRQLLGWRSYSWLTGRTEEEETARVRAWEIALDAQLTGGDAELSKGRLVLTLWAAGTLPKTPARIMLKALHLRVMFWQASDAFWVCKTLNFTASRLASYQWKLAQKLLESTTDITCRRAEDDMPDHLVALLQCSIEDVLTDANIERLHNLAWNRPANGLNELKFEDDFLAEDDNAMCGPLDILALSSSEYALKEALQAFIRDGKTSQHCSAKILYALRTAPPGSSSFVRVLAAMAILSENDLASKVTRLVQALPLFERNSSPRLPADFDSLPKTIRRDVMITIACTESIVMLLSARGDTASVEKAVDVLARSLSTDAPIGILGFAASLRLSHFVLEECSLELHGSSSMTQKLRNTIIQLESHLERTTTASKRRGYYRLALLRLLAHIPPRRRISAVAMDSGYESVGGEEDKS